MAVTERRARELVLALDQVSEAPHFDRIAFRTQGRIFATIARDGADMNFMLDPDRQEFYCEEAPHAFSPAPGAGGKNGATCCVLKSVDAAIFHGALAAAYARAMLG